MEGKHAVVAGALGRDGERLSGRELGLWGLGSYWSDLL
jgi:hypothetical protein